jgi:hypothetical protein
MFLLVAALATTVACERVKSANPTSPDIAGPIPGVEITAPRPLEPLPGQELVADGQPQTLLIENAGTNGQRELWLQVELSDDAGFSRLLHQADRLALGPNGRTTYRMPEPLGPGFTYFWRVRALDGANTGPYSNTVNFSVIAPVVIEAPTPVVPIGNISTNRPEFSVRNSRVTGPAGNVVYRFELATAPDPASIAAVVTTAANPSGTTSTIIGDLPYDRVFYWRVWATDGNTSSPYSAVIAFRTPPAPPPPPVPPTIPTPPAGPLPGGGGGGGRTPDPPAGQRLPLPNMAHVVQQVAAARPDLLRNSCQEHGGSWAFLDAVVDTLRTYDTRWGYNWKRGNVGDPSMDVVDYHWGRGGSENSTEVYIIDVIGGHCGSNPSPAWGDVTDVTYNAGSTGRWTGRGRF